MGNEVVEVIFGIIDCYYYNKIKNFYLLWCVEKLRWGCNIVKEVVEYFFYYCYY